MYCTSYNWYISTCIFSLYKTHIYYTRIVYTIHIFINHTKSRVSSSKCSKNECQPHPMHKRWTNKRNRVSIWPKVNSVIYYTLRFSLLAILVHFSMSHHFYGFSSPVFHLIICFFFSVIFCLLFIFVKHFHNQKSVGIFLYFVWAEYFLFGPVWAAFQLFFERIMRQTAWTNK